jgi:penicillin-binding protein-related factor A (putative recombinase)
MGVNESTLWQWLRGAEKTLGLTCHELHWRRVENAVGFGDPDVEGCYQGASFVVELKTVPRQKEIHCELATHQAQWLRSRARAGGAAFVLVQVGVGAMALRYLISAANCIELLSPISEERLMMLALISPGCKPIDILLQISIHRRDPVIDYRSRTES